MSEVTSTDIKKALAKRHGDREFFIAECKNGPTAFGTGLLQFDGIAIYKSWAHPRIVGYEVKVSRSDFLRDNKYSMYLPYCHEFYFVTPTGMVQRQEVEENIGLIWYNPATKALTTKKKAVNRDIEISADMLLYIIMNRLESDRLPFHNSKADYWQEWLEGKTSNRELGYNVKSKLLKQINELQVSKDSIQNLLETKDKYKELMNIMQKHGVSTYFDAGKHLEEALSREYPLGIDIIRDQLEIAIKEIDKLRIKSEVKPCETMM